MPGVSIALATLNGERFLATQLASLAGQTQLPAELIVSDDGSSDRTVEIVREFARTAPFPVSIARNDTRLGYRENFMRAAERCGSELIAYCDQDDIWEADKLAVMLPFFDDPKVLLAYHNATVIDDNGNRVGHLYKAGSTIREFAPLALEPWSLIAGFTQVFRRGLLRFSSLRAESIDPYWPAERLAHDQWQPFLASVFGSVIRVGQPLVRYRQHGNNVFGWENKPSLETAPSHFLQAESFAAAARNRSQILCKLLPSLSADERKRGENAIAFYESLQRRLEDRMSLYSSAGLLSRVARFQALLRQRAYSRAQGSARFGWKGLVLDAFAGVPLGPLAKRMIL